MSDKIKRVEIFTDGSCLGNPGPGGWGAILRYNGAEKELSGGEPETTNNRMELTAVIKSLECLKERCDVELYTDSQYVCNAVNKGWAIGWRHKGWKRSGNEPALNSDLWAVLLDLLEAQNVKFNWVRGHVGHPENERCDRLAVSESEKFKN